MRRFVSSLAVMFIVGVMVPPSAFAKELEVETQDNVFVPATITISVGDSISFRNTGVAPHTATAKDKSWDTGNLNAGQSKSVTFSKAGTFDYSCIYHESLGMVGKVVVEGAGGRTSPAVAAQASPPSPTSAPDEDAEVAAAARQNRPPNPNATVPIGVKAFPYLALGLLLLFGVAVFAGYLKNLFRTTGPPR